ncbi:uncharacterized protein LOC143202603 isoform X2 [Rhynchophorus ferrugineus]|uniref:Uncharacterized protein n=1 Tax=Rhynchophorus ferrugineus TaxID=354439 RepID=A0A834M1X2_RHYFE|nr:hypothetical protein GWI33_018876 [Rhynchophorus ferrugineus]
MSDEINEKTKKDVITKIPHSGTSKDDTAIASSTRTETPNHPQKVIDKGKNDLSSSSDEMSVYNAIKFVKPLKSIDTQSDYPPESEEELQVIEFGSKCNETTPLLIMFPELKQEGKKAEFPLLRKNQELFKNKHTLAPIEEFPENMSYEQIAWTSPRSTLSSEPTDISDEETDL